MSRDLSENDKRKRNNLLTQYYGIGEEKDVENPFDLDGKNFNPDAFVNKLVKESSLKQLVDKERDLVREIQSLDSEMQTLVYENYNKFILATDTIRQMKSDFKTMEDEMEKLVQEMSNISTFASNISSNLQDRRQQITKLSDIHELLKNLQFLFDLPKKLKGCVEEKNYSLAVKYFVKSEQVLEEFGDHPSFKGIKSDCRSIVSTLKANLKEQFIQADVTSRELEECISLLCKLNESPTELAQQYMAINRERLEKDLDNLVSETTVHSDSEEDRVHVFVDQCCNSVLNNVALTIATFNNVFPTCSPEIKKEMANISIEIVHRLCPIVERRIIELIGTDTSESGCLSIVASLDKFHRRLLAVQRLLLVDEQWSQSMISNVARTVAEQTAVSLLSAWALHLQQWRECWSDSVQLHDSVKQLESTLIEQIQRAFVALMAFVGNHVTFSNDWQFRQTFGRVYVREGVLMKPLKQLSTMLNDLGDLGKNTGAPTRILVLSRVAIDFNQQLAPSLLSLVEEQFDIPSGFQDDHLTPISTVLQDFKITSQSLLQRYVQTESHTLVQMIRKSMDSRDWLTASEPRGVRPVIKRILEEIARVDSHAALMYEEGSRKKGGSETSSSRRTHQSVRMQQKSSWSSLGPSQMDSSLLNNIQKLFSERIDLSGMVEPNKGSVVMAIIKICLKGFLECVRLKTFGKYGIQQIQVDCYYLQLFLWRFTSDESLVHGLLDEILSSAVQRCLELVLMEPSVVELICER